jgi:hypothetical protein
MHALAGLDYLSGDTSPWAPALDPGGIATFKWQVQPTAEKGPLIASLSLESPGTIPMVRVLAIPRLPAQPRPESAMVSNIPTARTGEMELVLENSKIRARVVSTESNIPVLLFSIHTVGGWRQIGVSVPLAEVLSGEGGQRPWWEVFKSEGCRASQGKDEASLSLAGGFGVRWRATVTLRLRANSTVIDYGIQIAPTRQMKLSGVRFCTFLAGEGSFGAISTEALIARPSGPNTVSAVRWGEITVGRLEQTALQWQNWESAPASEIDGADYRLLGTEAYTTNNPAVYEAGAVVKLRARLFALTPSVTVYDALNIALPMESPK